MVLMTYMDKSYKLMVEKGMVSILVTGHIRLTYQRVEVVRFILMLAGAVMFYYTFEMPDTHDFVYVLIGAILSWVIYDCLSAAAMVLAHLNIIHATTETGKTGTLLFAVAVLFFSASITLVVLTGIVYHHSFNA